MALNRRRDDKTKIRCEDLELDEDDDEIDDGLGGSGAVQYDNLGFLSSPKIADDAAPPSLCSVSTGSRLDGGGGLIRESASAADAICKIYVCATMWHESALEMTCMLKSLFRLDEDQCARRNAQKYLKVVDPDYYEFEAHIFLDDAFEPATTMTPATNCGDDVQQPMVNKYVRQLIEKMNEAARWV